MNEDFYNLTQLDSLNFVYSIAISEKRIEDWLLETLEEGVDFIFGETVYSTRACTVHVKFLNEKSAVAFKLRWL